MERTGERRGKEGEERRDRLYSLLVSSARTGDLSGHLGVELCLLKNHLDVS